MPASQSLCVRFALMSILAFGSVTLLSGCGGGMSSGGGGVTGTNPGTTSVTLAFTSTANDQLTEYSAAIASIALMDKAGNTVTLYNNGNVFLQAAEFMHLNGVAEPFVTATVPQGTYTSAVVHVGGCSFETITDPGPSLSSSVFDEGLCSEGTGTTTVNLAAPIQISGAAQELVLNLQVGSSWTLIPAAVPGFNATYTIDPVFTLTTVPLSAQPTNLNNGFFAGVGAQVVATNATPATATIQLSSGQSFTVKPATTATYQGITGFSALVTNEIVNMDLALQADGSLAATRVEVNDPASVFEDTGLFVTPNSPLGTWTVATSQPEGCANGPQNFQCSSVMFWDSASVFGTSGQFLNVASLPFAASFIETAATQGQNVSGSIFGAAAENAPYAQKITLEPQTLNGIVQSMTTENGFAVYTVSLAPYDIFPVTQQAGVAPPPYASVITNPQTMVVYADTSAQFLNSGTVEPGQTLRFRGIVFNDNGALRMDCNTVLDGVPQ
jgi:hypothetical protein